MGAVERDAGHDEKSDGDSDSVGDFVVKRELG